MSQTRDTIEQIKRDAERITKQRLEDAQGLGAHEAREAEVNAMEGVTQGTPVLEAAQANPSEPGTANFQTLNAHEGPKNVHSTDGAPTASSVLSAKQAEIKGSNSTKEKESK